MLKLTYSYMEQLPADGGTGSGPGGAPVVPAPGAGPVGSPPATPPVIPADGPVELKGFTLKDDQIVKLHLTDEQRALHTAGKGAVLTTEQREILKGLITPAATLPGGYNEFVLPEGVTLNKALMEKIGPLFKESGLDQTKAQKLITAYAEQVKQQGIDTQAAAQSTYEQEVINWENTVKADKVLGGDNFNQTKKLSALTMDKLGTPELKVFFDKYGVGSHPEIVRLFVKVGKMLPEDNPAGGGTGGKQKIDILEQMYPGQSGKPT